ncbi:MAG TPA: hypothetical protein VF406_19245 [Thermodesulfobacteriota bacterium]
MPDRVRALVAPETRRRLVVVEEEVPGASDDAPRGALARALAP